MDSTDPHKRSRPDTASDYVMNNRIACMITFFDPLSTCTHRVSWRRRSGRHSVILAGYGNSAAVPKAPDGCMITGIILSVLGTILLLLVPRCPIARVWTDVGRVRSKP